MARGITKRQADVLQYIVDFINDEGYPPTIAEIAVHFKIKSTNGVNDHLVALERKGYITRTKKARSIQLTGKGEHSLYRAPAEALPLVGCVAAGSPILAQENIEEFVPVSAHQAHEGGYCLRVRGDSMIEDGILDGDTIIVDGKRSAKKGDVVVALVDEDEATVKRYIPHGATVELMPANCEMEPIIVPASMVQIQGVVVGLQRDIA